MLGNGLRELDRFMNILLDELVRVQRWADVRIDRFTRIRNTVRKLHLVSARLGLPEPDLNRWRALGRCRDCLFHTGGVVRRGDLRTGATMTLGWPARGRPGLSSNSIAIGKALHLTADDVAWICGLYDRIAGELVAQSVLGGRSIHLEESQIDLAVAA